MQKYIIPIIPTNVGKDSSEIDDNSNFYIESDVDKVKNFISTGSSTNLFDTEYIGIKNTQEIDLDWSKFENHTFFNSAQSKVTVAFDKIINEFPFDSTEFDIQTFLKGLTGFEKYVYDQFPFSTGSLLFSGSIYPENGNNGTYIIVKDSSGNEFSSISKDTTGTKKLNFNKTSFSAQFNLYLPTIINQNQTIFQKQDGNNLGFALYVSQSSNINAADVSFYIGSGSYLLTSSVKIEKGKFHNLCFSLDRNSNTLFTYKNDSQYSKSNSLININSLANDAQLIIGSGSTWNNSSLDITFIPKETFSGSLDEFRLFDKFITYDDFLKTKDVNIYADKNLKLYYKFNEPAIEISSDPKRNSIILDSSGNSLHSYVFNINFFKNNYNKLRCRPELSKSVPYEILEYSPVLFTSHPQIISLSENLLYSGSLYDIENPNLITKLIPQHYLSLGKDIEGKENEFSGLSTQIENDVLPAEANNNNVQILLTFLYTFAKFFDEIKVYTDTFTRLLKIDYDPNTSVPDQFIDILFDYFGFNTPSIFNNSYLEQFKEGIGTLESYSKTIALKKVKNEILKRLLVSLPEIIKSKGTHRAIESYIRTLGIEPNTNFKIKEYGGPITRPIKNLRVKKQIVLPLITVTNSERIYSPHLLGVRSEPGEPKIAGDFINGISNNISDGLYTSGSWSFEALYKLENKESINLVVDQSLARLYVQGDSLGGVLPENPGLIFNLVAHKDLNKNPDKHNVILYGRPGWDLSINDSPLLILSSNVNIYDGNIWHICFGKKRKNSPENIFLSSSYFISISKQIEGEIFEHHYEEKFFQESILENSSISKISNSFNKLGSYFEIGNSNIDNTIPIYLNSFSEQPTNFNGQVSNVRFWSKALTKSEIREHTENYLSFGVENSLINYNFSSKNSGSFERLIIDCSINQDNKFSDEFGNINLFDYSQNELHLIGENFSATKSPFIGYNTIISQISHDIDTMISKDKVRVRSYQDLNNANILDFARESPVYELENNQMFIDNEKLSIELSVSDALNTDIINIFATLEKLENILGSPENLFSGEYKDLESLRSIYFNRLTDKINIKSFYDLFKWFDESMNKFISQIIPRKTKFLGVNFVLEQHLLERSKYEHKMYSQYLYNGKLNIVNLLGFSGRITNR